MYVCLCNCITERQAEKAVAAGARRPLQVHAEFGTRPQCGRCVPMLREMLGRDAERRSSTSAHSRNSLA